MTHDGPSTHEWMFYEVMWRAWARRTAYPLPWWLQQTFRRWIDNFDAGLFDSKEAALASNALYRYWNMVGVKDAHQESLVGQAGEIEPVYERYAVTLLRRRRRHGCTCRSGWSPAAARRRWPSTARTATCRWSSPPTARPPGSRWSSGRWRRPSGLRQRAVVLNRLVVRATGGGPQRGELGVAVIPVKPSGFVRHDRAGRYLADSTLSFLRYLPAERRLETNTFTGPVFDTAPAAFGLYGNPNSSWDPDRYLADEPVRRPRLGRRAERARTRRPTASPGCARPPSRGRSTLAAGQELTVDLRLPIDDFRGAGDFAELAAPAAADLEAGNLGFWRPKLTGSGLQAQLPPVVAHLADLFRSCRADLLILADDGAIHPGPPSTTRSGSATPASRPSPARSPATPDWPPPSSASTT